MATFLDAKGVDLGDVAPAVRAAFESAREAGLRYVSDSSPGFRRVRTDSGFVYRYASGAKLRDAAALDRIRRLAIPPAWENVWICADERGHLQATGRDARGRKQYRYHAKWRSTRDADKFERLAEFGAALPRIRRQVRQDLARPGLERIKVVAAVARLLETTFIRVGNTCYARSNGSYGLTTMRNKHVRLSGGTIRFQFVGKSGRQHAIEMTDPRLARIIRRCRELPGFELFRYLEDGEVRTVDSSDVNDYLHEIGGADYTAKDFRTWGASVIALQAFEERTARPMRSRGLTRSAVNEVIAAVATQLGNTAAICRKCYVHPAVVEAFVEGRAPGKVPARRGLNLHEAKLLRLLNSQSRGA